MSPLGEVEFRIAERLLMAVYKRDSSPRVYSRDHYALVRHDGGYALESAGQDEWNAAEPLMPYSDSVFLGDRSEVKVGNQNFRTSAPFLAGVFKSGMRNVPDPLDGLVVGGFDGTDGHGDLGMLFSNPSDGRYIFDLYQASTGRKYAAITGEYHNINPGSLLARSFWIQGPRFVLPVEANREFRRLLVCELPGNARLRATLVIHWIYGAAHG